MANFKAHFNHQIWIIFLDKIYPTPRNMVTRVNDLFSIELDLIKLKPKDFHTLKILNSHTQKHIKILITSSQDFFSHHVIRNSNSPAVS